MKEDKILKKYKKVFEALEEYDRTGKLPKIDKNSIKLEKSNK